MNVTQSQFAKKTLENFVAMEIVDRTEMTAGHMARSDATANAGLSESEIATENTPMKTESAPTKTESVDHNQRARRMLLHHGVLTEAGNPLPHATVKREVSEIAMFLAMSLAIEKVHTGTAIAIKKANHMIEKEEVPEIGKGDIVTDIATEKGDIVTETMTERAVIVVERAAGAIERAAIVTTDHMTTIEAAATVFAVTETEIILAEGMKTESVDLSLLATHQKCKQMRQCNQ